MKTVLTCGTFDLFHIGHLRVLERARALGDYLVVGVSSDALNIEKKQRAPIMSQEQRMSIVAALKCVDKVFLEESLELKKQYIQEQGATVFCIGDDWKGKFDGIAFFSLDQLPKKNEMKKKIFDVVLKKRKKILISQENILIKDKTGISKVEELLKIKNLLTFCPKSLI